MDDGTVLTRREFNERFDEQSPEPFELPDHVQYLWDWYFDADRRISRMLDGSYRLIPPSEWLAWRDITRSLVRTQEFAILAAMDRAYASAVNEEIEAGRALADEQKGK